MPTTLIPRDRAAINRENALKSTGPKTEAGKQKCALNALRHGLTAQTVVLPTDDLNLYQDFTQKFHDDLKPFGALEIQLVQSLADDAWRLNRAKAIETNLFSLGLHEKAGSILTDNDQVRDALAIADALREQTRALNSLSMHQNRIARTFERDLRLLQTIQDARRKREREDIVRASSLYLSHQEKANSAEPGTLPPYDPSDDGFVFTLPEIEEFLWRKNTLAHAYHAI